MTRAIRNTNAITVRTVTVVAIAGMLLATLGAGATEPNRATAGWWAHVRALADDAMAGRDAGSRGHQKAVDYVVSRFSRAGVAPAGESGFLQEVPLHAARFRADRSSAAVRTPDGKRTSLKWLRQIVMPPRLDVPPTLDAPMGFAGWQIGDAFDVRGRVLVTLGPPRFVAGARAYAQTPPQGYAGTITVESAAGPEPVPWPAFSSLAMTLRDVPLPRLRENAPMFYQFNPADAEVLFQGSGHSYAELRAIADAGRQLPSFPLNVSLHLRVAVDAVDLTSHNVIGVVRGSDPVLANEYVAVSAHLDGFGVGEPVNGDRIYNGALDDAAYVATLIDFAEGLRAAGTRFKRSILFCVFTAEERGLLGSQFFLAHPTIPKERIVANINLDQLRPLFPLNSLTALAVDNSTLGGVVRAVGKEKSIDIRPDLEPDRNQLRRSDQWSFIQAGIPALSFLFAYDPGSSEETLMRRWYADRYHRPADDLKQPWDPAAAAGFNAFFARLVEAVADDPVRPGWISRPPSAP